MAEEENPFKAPDAVEQSEVKSDDFDDDNYELIRKQHINTETKIKAVAALILLGAIFTIFSLIGLSTQMNDPMYAEIPEHYFPIVMVLNAIQGVLLFMSGVKLRKLFFVGAKLYAATIALGMSGIFIDLTILELPRELLPQLIGQYVGSMIIPLIILAFIMGKKARVVYSEEYRMQVIPATPHVKYKSPWLILLLIVIVVVVVIGIAASR